MLISNVVDRASKCKRGSCEGERNKSEYQWYEWVSEDHIAEPLIVCSSALFERLICVCSVYALGRTSSPPWSILVWHHFFELVLRENLGGWVFVRVCAACGKGVPS